MDRLLGRFPPGESAAPGAMARVTNAILAISSRTTAWWTASSAVFPQVKAPCPATRTIGVLEGSRPRKQSRICRPVSAS